MGLNGNCPVKDPFMRVSQGGPCSLVLFQYCPMFPCSHALYLLYQNLFVLYFFEFCSLVPKNWLKFLCSLQYFANVPLFPKTPGRPSFMSTHRTHAAGTVQKLLHTKQILLRLGVVTGKVCISSAHDAELKADVILFLLH